jgi:beta-phosphoglucomutase
LKNSLTNSKEILCVIFDLDGVLVDACEWHRVALNQALMLFSNYEITLKEHHEEYNGIPTRVKLEKLVQRGIVDPSDISKIENEKQRLTIEIIKSTAKIREEKISLLKLLKSKNIKTACYTNSIRETAELMLEKTGILELFDLLVTNQDVTKAKPDPEGYLRCMKEFSVDADQCLIVEDSPNGVKAAKSSGAHVCIVRSPEDVKIESIMELLT